MKKLKNPPDLDRKFQRREKNALDDRRKQIERHERREE